MTAAANQSSINANDGSHRLHGCLWVSSLCINVLQGHFLVANADFRLRVHTTAWKQYTNTALCMGVG